MLSVTSKTNIPKTYHIVFGIYKNILQMSMY